MSLAIVTDLDGCLLDPHTYSAAAAMGAVRRIEAEGIPLILCSSKTRAEIDLVQRQLGISGPFISENGGGIFLPDGYFGALPPEAVAHAGRVCLPLGLPYSTVVRDLQAASAEAGVPILGFFEMSVDDIAVDCGLPPLVAQLAKQREFDEPFRILSDDLGARSRLLQAAHQRGLRTVCGGRYHHATGPTDKGAAVALLRGLYRENGQRLTLIGLGDGPNDLSLLRSVDLPIIVRSDAYASTASLLRKVPTARVSELSGPAGWAQAVMAELNASAQASSLARTRTVRG